MDKQQQSRHDDKQAVAVGSRLRQRLAHFLVRSSCATTTSAATAFVGLAAATSNNNPAAAVNARQEPSSPAGRRASPESRSKLNDNRCHQRHRSSGERALLHVSIGRSASARSVGAAAVLASPMLPMPPAKVGGVVKAVTKRSTRNKKKGNNNGELRASSYYYGWSSSTSSDGDGELAATFSSDEDRGAEADTARSSTLFSSRSRSFSSDSTSDLYNATTNTGSKSKRRRRRPPPIRGDDVMGKKTTRSNKKGDRKNNGAVDAAAVVKRSHDPYADFRSSMSEMVASRRIRGADALTELLVWYLSLNSPRHHPVILSAFHDVVSSSSDRR